MGLNLVKLGIPFSAAMAILSAGSNYKDAILQDNNSKANNNEVENKNRCRMDQAEEAIRRFMVQNSIPGLSAGVSVNGKIVWKSGFGYSDVEKGTLCNGQTVMRIASISKPLTASVAARLVQAGQLNLDKPIQEYVNDFPLKTLNGEEVQITTRQLLSHTGGIRHYKKSKKDHKIDVEKDTSKQNDKDKTSGRSENSFKDQKQVEGISNQPDTVYEEFYSPKQKLSELKWSSWRVTQNKPGTKFLYTTHGFTLVSAVLEKAAKKDFPSLLKDTFRQLNMNHTHLDFNQSIIPHRTRYYYRDEKHRLQNCPEVDNSYKWGGGGLISCVADLLKFANVILYRFHTGAAIGAASVLLIRPSRTRNSEFYPHGVCVAILINIQDCAAGITQLALELSEIFSEK